MSTDNTAALIEQLEQAAASGDSDRETSKLMREAAAALMNISVVVNIYYDAWHRGDTAQGASHNALRAIADELERRAHVKCVNVLSR